MWLPLHAHPCVEASSNSSISFTLCKKLVLLNCHQKSRVVSLLEGNWLQHLTHISPDSLESAPPRPVAPLPAFLRVGDLSTPRFSAPLYSTLKPTEMPSRKRESSARARPQGGGHDVLCTPGTHPSLFLLPKDSPVAGTFGFLIKNAEVSPDGGFLVERNMIDATFLPTFTFGDDPAQKEVGQAASVLEDHLSKSILVCVLLWDPTTGTLPCVPVA